MSWYMPSSLAVAAALSMAPSAHGQMPVLSRFNPISLDLPAEGTKGTGTLRVDSQDAGGNFTGTLVVNRVTGGLPSPERTEKVRETSVRGRIVVDGGSSSPGHGYKLSFQEGTISSTMQVSYEGAVFPTSGNAIIVAGTYRRLQRSVPKGGPSPPGPFPFCGRGQVIP
jgi:hypothetical protein